MRQVLYHGSKSGLEGVIRPSSRPTCDFGRAFYMGESAEQPLTLICHSKAPKLYQLALNDEGLITRDIGDDLVWALFVAYNRGAMTEYSDTPLARKMAAIAENTDLLCGRIANDRVFQTVQMFFERTITLETLSEVLKAVNLGRQICAVSQRACERIEVVTVREISESECEALRVRSENQRHRAVEQTDRIIDARRRKDGIFFDELCEKYRNGEGLPEC